MPELHVGICGAGIGGLAAAIAMRKAGIKVTVLEAASELGDIGAGIQMTPNVSRLLIRWGVDRVIGKNLVEFEEVNLRRKDGTVVGHAKTVPNVKSTLGVPWWLVHRMHLHDGLANVAKQEGAEIFIDSRVVDIDWTSTKQVAVTTEKGRNWTFDLLVGADGLKSIVRKKILPDVKPRAPSGNCAYRAIVPMDKVRNDPIAKELIGKSQMDIWMSPKAYIISYPISNGEDFNMVWSHHRDQPVEDVEDVDMEEVRLLYRDFDERIRRICDLVPTVRRWPLLVTGPLDTWSSPQKNVVLMGDAAHSMVNHMAQSAATSMEDGAFFARTLARVVEGKLDIAQAINIYEKTRMPLAYNKQQVSFINGQLWMLPDGPLQQARDNAMEHELRGNQLMRSPNLYTDPYTTLTIFNYDAEADAEIAINAHLEGQEPYDKNSGLTRREMDRFFGYWWPKDMPMAATPASKL